MAKIKLWTYGEIFSWIVFEHFPLSDPTLGNPWHLVHEYTGDIYDYMGSLNQWNSQFFADPDTARLCALSLAAHPQVTTDLCPVCRPKGFQFYGALPVPRWNIYRGLSLQPHVPAIYWDQYNPDPPPGFAWEYPYPWPPP